MRRALLPFAMVLSLWPIGLIAVSMATGSSSQDSAGGEVTVAVPPELSKPGAPAKKARVRLKLDGKTYSCPVGTRARLDPIDEDSARTKLRLRAVRRDAKPIEARLDRLDKLYPGKSAPSAVAEEYNALLRRFRSLSARDDRLIRRYNRNVDRHNQIIDSVCS